MTKLFDVDNIKNTVKYIVAEIFFVAIIVVVFCHGGNLNKSDAFLGNNIVVHALGAVDGHNGLNCLEGFELAYENGQRVFETDICETSDGHLVLAHSFDDTKQQGIDGNTIPNLYKFLSSPIYGQYTPLSFKQFIDIIYDLDDVYIVTDFKTVQTEDTLYLLKKAVDELKEEHKEDVLHRFIVQFYNEEELEQFKEIADFGEYVLTLYKTDFDGSKDEFSDVCEFCRHYQIKSIVMQKRYWNPEIANIADTYGITVYPHTENDIRIVKHEIDSGVGGVYSDSLTQADYDYLSGIDKRWFKSGKMIFDLNSNKGSILEDAYSQGERVLHINDFDSQYNKDIVDFIKSHNDTFIMIDFDEGLIKNIMNEAAGCEREVFKQLVVCIDDYEQTSFFRKQNICWCDFVYMASSFVEEHKEYGFSESLLQSRKNGIATIAFEDSLWDDNYSDIRDEYKDINVYLFSGKYK